MNKVFKSALVAIALGAAPVAIGVVNAQTAPASTTTATASVNYATVFLGKLATSLGITQEKLSSGLKDAGNATVDEALKNQDITKTQADAMKLRVQAGEYTFFSRGGHDGFDGRGFGGRDGGRDGGFGGGRDGGFGAGHDGGSGGVVMFEATAKALGVTISELSTQLQSGKTISEIAKAKNISETVVHDAAVAAYKTQLQTKVTAGTLTQAQADERLKVAQADAAFGLQLGRGGHRR
jgi:hypothetical protein